MHFEIGLLRWASWTLFLSLVVGGIPWRFPANGKYWLDAFVSNKNTVTVYPGSVRASGRDKELNPSQYLRSKKGTKKELKLKKRRKA